MNRLNLKNAFTLLELLIAVSIFSVVMIALYSAFRAGIFGFSSIEAGLNANQTAVLFMNRINTDLRNCFKYSQTETKFKGTKETLEFFTLINLPSEGRALRKYAFVSYKKEGGSIIRSYRTALDAVKLEPENKTSQPFDNIKECSFSYLYYDPNNKEFKEREKWDDPVTFPAAIRIELLSNERRNPVFQRTVFLPNV